MRRIRLFVMSAFLVAATSPLSLKVATAEVAGQENREQDIRYLLTFKALPHHQKKERNFYELAREITGFIDGRFFPPAGIVTGEEVRYDVFMVKKTRVLRSTNSHESPQSQQDGFYILAYNPVYKLCAKNYSIDIKNTGRGKINYIDCESGKKYEFPVAARQPFGIFEVEILTENILREVWQQKHSAN